MAKTMPSSDYFVFYNGTLLPTARLIEVDQSVGARQEDYAKLEIPFIDGRAKDELNRLLVVGGSEGSYLKATQGVPLMDGSSPATISVVVEGETIHVGVITEVDYKNGETGESITVVSRVDNAMFGQPIDGMKVHSGNLAAGILSDSLQVGRKLVFNPFLDGKQYPNCWNAGNIAFPQFQNIAFLDTESVPKRFINDPLNLVTANLHVHFWTIQLALWYLCKELNPNEQFFVNPDFSEVKAAIKGDDVIAAAAQGKAPSYMLLGFEIPLNSTLPEALDLIVNAFGAYWYLKDIPGNVTKRKIAFGQRNLADQQRKLVLFRVPELNPDVPICSEIDVKIDRSARFASDVLVIGGPITFEITMNLMAGWDPAKDNTPIYSLSMDKISKDPTLADIRRRWVANETGEYNNWTKANSPSRGVTLQGPRRDLLDAVWEVLRAAAQAGVVPNLPPSLYRRFHAGKCLTLDATGESIGTGHGQVLLEAKRSGGTWDDLTKIDGSASWQLLENEIGIYFTGTLPPASIRPDQVEMRMTFSITLPTAIQATASHPNVRRDAFLSYRRTHVSHEPTRFNFRFRGKASKFGGGNVFPPPSYDAVDDRLRIAEYATQLHNSWSTATCEGSAAIQGLVTWYRLGDQIISEIEDNIDFNVASGTEPRHPTITGIRHVAQESATIIRFGLFGREDFI